MWETHYDPISDKFLADAEGATTPHELDELIYQRFMSDYFQAVKALDDSVGNLVSFLTSTH